jgi:tetrahydromethanopterin S-methyltransferase subunit F
MEREPPILEGVTYSVKCSADIAKRIWPEAKPASDHVTTQESIAWARAEFGLAGFALGFVTAVVLTAVML